MVVNEFGFVFSFTDKKNMKVRPAVIFKIAHDD